MLRGGSYSACSSECRSRLIRRVSKLSASSKVVSLLLHVHGRKPHRWLTAGASVGAGKVTGPSFLHLNFFSNNATDEFHHKTRVDTCNGCRRHQEQEAQRYVTCEPHSIAAANPAPGATDAAPKAKKARKSDDVAAVAKPAKASKTAPASTEANPVKAKSSRKQATDFFSDDEVPVAESAPVKVTKASKKSKTVAPNGDAVETAVEIEVQEKLKKGGKKAKAAATEEVSAIEAPKEKTKKATKTKKAEPTPVVEEVPIVEESASKKTKKTKSKKQAESKPLPEVAEEADEMDVDADADADDQTAALLAGFESDDDTDPDADVDFDENAEAPIVKLSKKQKLAIAKAEKNTKANEPGVVYVGYV